MDLGNKYERITATTRNWRFSGYMKFCASYQVQWCQTVFVSEILFTSQQIKASLSGQPATLRFLEGALGVDLSAG